MADNYKDTGKMTEKQKVQEITEKLEQGIREVFESEKYKAYLNTMSKFHTYSFNNTMLIAMQKPDATLVAGYQAWQKNFDRHVKRGEKGIRILAPAPYKVKEEQEKTDPETGEIILDKNGMPVMEEVEVKIPSFRVVPVFDVSQTEGKELPDIGVSELSGGVKDYEEFMQALMEVSPVPIGYEQIEGDSKGYFHTSEHRIALQEGMSQSQTVKTAVHEVAHAKLHDRDLNSNLEETMSKDRSTKEVEAESVAYTVCQHFGIDTSDYSFGYIAGWSSGKDMRELKSSLDTIRKTASELITDISGRLQELKRDRVEEQELSAMRKAEKLIGELEKEKTIFTDVERNLIVNYMYKFDDMDKTRELAEKLVYMIENQPVNEALTVIDAQAEIDRLPDGMVGLSEMHEYGYTWEEMLPLTQERALELFGENVTIYQLHADGSETLVEDTEDFKHEGMFGVEKADWNAYLEQQERKAELEENPADRETQLLQGNENQFGIYQLKDSPQTEEVRFMNSDFWEMKGIAIAKEHYQLVYAAPLEEGMTLEDIFTKFNIDRPEDFKGHSLSVSDVVVLHQNGENTSHFVDSFGYKEVPEFIQAQERTEELQMEKAEEQKETTQEMIAESEERGNAVFLVNYGEWKAVSELDLEQNYFAIDDPYGDGDFRLYWLQNEIKDITPAGAVYSTPEEAAQALEEAEREIANLPYNKENNIGSYMVNGKAQLERIMEERSLQKHLDMENDRVSYYVIEDISTWAENSPEKSKLERFDSFTKALEQFRTYRKKGGQFHDDKARTTFSVNVHGIEFDVIHARNNENVLSLDFTHSSEALQSQHFMDDLQILCNELVDKVRVHREMTPEEVKQFVKERLEYQLHSSGLEDISVYMNRFDTLYEQGKMEHLMPTANQKHIVEDIPLTGWENEYISIHNRYADLAEKELSVVEYEILLGMEPAQVSVDGLMEMMNSSGELWNYPMEEKEHCLQENTPVVTVRDGEEARYFEIPEE